MGTSQSAIARIEAGEENITLATLERLVKTLKGRFLVSIQPEEFPFIRPKEWWAPVVNTTTSPWVVQFVVVNREGNAALAGMLRDTSISPSGVIPTCVAGT